MGSDIQRGGKFRGIEIPYAAGEFAVTDGSVCTNFTTVNGVRTPDSPTVAEVLILKQRVGELERAIKALATNP